MKRYLFHVILIVSLAVNIAVAGTLIWHLSLETDLPAAVPDPGSGIKQIDLREIRRACSETDPGKMRAYMDQIRAKRLEIIETIAAKPERPEVADKAIDELMRLRRMAEKEALSRLGRVIARLPEDRRKAFLNYLKYRACHGPGMGCGYDRGRGKGRGCGLGSRHIK